MKFHLHAGGRRVGLKASPRNQPCWVATMILGTQGGAYHPRMPKRVAHRCLMAQFRPGITWDRHVGEAWHQMQGTAKAWSWIGQTVRIPLFTVLAVTFHDIIGLT